LGACDGDRQRGIAGRPARIAAMGEEALVCDQGMLLRFGGEQTILPLRVVLYAIGLGWCFMGVAIISDVFMVAIEHITSKKRRRFVESKNRYVTETVWNETVANLTLMALGSSAPEILINILEIFRDDFFNGPKGSVPLGPSTIVGSAAFNLFVIIGVCVSVIPDGEVRSIKEYSVFVVTAVFSVVAYLWLLVILLLISPHAVEVWEGVLTFLFFPALVFIAWCVDKGYILKTTDHRGSCMATEMTKEELAELETRIRKEHGPNLAEDQVAKFVQIYCGEHSSRAKYRIAATRAMVGGKPVPLPNVLERRLSGFARWRSSISRKVQPFDAQSILPDASTSARTGPNASSQGSDGSFDHSVCIIEFSESKKAVLENAGSVTVVVVRSGGDLSLPCSVDYNTRDGTAHAPSDFVEVKGTLEFAPEETTKTIQVTIVDDFSYEENEEFYLDLSNARVTRSAEKDVPGSVCSGGSLPPEAGAEVCLGPRSTLTIVIVDDDLPGILGFPEDELKVVEKVTDHEVQISVQRKHGSVGKVTCAYRFEDASAKSGRDYDGSSGVLEFGSQEIERTIPVMIKARGRYDQAEDFRVILEGPITGGAKFDPESDGGTDCCILTVVIECESVARDRVDRLMTKMQSRWDKAKVGHSDWRDQIVSAVLVNGGEEDGGEGDEANQDGPSAMDYAMHVITVPWKLLFALCPPPTYCGGWLTFYVALGFIGFVTALISDLANLLGCSLGICNAITAITLVALGTSLPDTFASKSAATQDPYADASIVNVTGSNSVNVFLGLGLPWMLGSIKWAVSGRTSEWDERYATDDDIALAIRQGHGSFIVKAGDLGYSVGIFMGGASVCLLILTLRRRHLKGELGGPRAWKYLTSCVLVLLWVLYVVLSSWKSSQGYC